jgi:hypothetical protein
MDRQGIYFRGHSWKWFDYHKTKKNAQAQVKRAKAGKDGITAMLKPDTENGGYNVYIRMIKK